MTPVRSYMNTLYIWYVRTCSTTYDVKFFSKTQLAMIDQMQDVSTRGSLSTAYLTPLLCTQLTKTLGLKRPAFDQSSPVAFCLILYQYIINATMSLNSIILTVIVVGHYTGFTKNFEFASIQLKKYVLPPFASLKNLPFVGMKTPTVIVDLWNPHSANI